MLKKQRKGIIYQNVIYTIKEEENTASVIGSISKIVDIFIPCSIMHNAKEYIVTSISENAFNRSGIQSVQFPSDSQLQIIEKQAFHASSIRSIKIPSTVVIIEEKSFYLCQELQEIEIPKDSKLKTIEKNAFFASKIESIKIPADLIELKEKWCIGTSYLNKITISPKNPKYCCLDEKIVVGKSNLDLTNYDCLIFCARNAKDSLIPSFIEHISSCSFNFCKLDRIEFTFDSKIQTIGNDAFSYSFIKYIKIPSTVKIIRQNAFSYCNHLQYIEFPDDSKLKKIEYEAFSSSSIKFFKIPSKVTLIESSAFFCCNNLQRIEFPDDSKLQKISSSLFLKTQIESIKIPSKITLIGSGSFSGCKKLNVIVIPDDSKLQKIEEFAFTSSSIKSILIPASLKQIEKNAFCECFKLQIIEIKSTKFISIYEKAFKDCTNAILMAPYL